MEINKYRRLLEDIVVFSIGTVLTKVIQFVLMPLYTTYMTTEAYGIAELTNNISELLLPIATFCIYEAAFRYVIGSKFKSNEILTASMKVLFISAILGALICIIINFFFYYEYTGYLYLILYTYSLKTFFSYYVRGKGQTKLFAVSGVVNAFFLAFFNYIFLVFLDDSVKGYLLAISLSYTFSLLFLFFEGRLYIDFKCRISTKNITVELLKYSSPLILYNISYWLTTMCGRYILLWNTDASTAGIYAAVIKIAAVINMFQQAFYAAFQINTSREYNSDDKEIYFSKIFSMYSQCVLLSGGIMLCISPILAKFTLKNEFYVAKVYLPLVLFAAIIDCVFCFFKTMYTTYKLTKRTVPSMILGAIVNIIAASLLVKEYEIWGICFATLLSYAAQTVYRVVDVRKFINIKCDWKRIFIYLILLSIQVVLLSGYKPILYIGALSIACLMILDTLYTNRYYILRKTK